jgi:hypothetical protein
LLRPLIILLPGYDARVPGSAQERLAASLAATDGSAPRQTRIDGRVAQRIRHGGLSIDLIEVFWADAAPRGGGASSMNALLTASGLIRFWWFGAWRRSAVIMCGRPL